MNNILKQHKFTNKYKRKYKYLKKLAKSLIVENAALCDEVARIQETILIVKDERKFLLRKLLDYENEMELPQANSNRNTSTNSIPNGSAGKLKKRRSPDSSRNTPV